MCCRVTRYTNILDSLICIIQVVTVGYIKAGEAGNVIPEYLTLGGTYRSLSSEGLSYLQKRIREVKHELLFLIFCQLLL